MNKLHLHNFAVLACLAWLALGCAASPTGLPAQPTRQISDPTAPTGLTVEQLKNATYTFAEAPGGSITLQNGQAEVSIAPDSATQVKAVLLSPVSFGDLDGAGGTDAASIVVIDPGGSGSFYYLVALLDQDGEPAHAASILLGDRIKIGSVSIEDGQIRVVYLDRKPDEPFTTEPSQVVMKTYRLLDGRLEEVTEE